MRKDLLMVKRAKDRNLKERLWGVYFVFPPDETPDFVAIRRGVHDYLGCSHLEGIFTAAVDARYFARDLAEKKGVLIG